VTSLIIQHNFIEIHRGTDEMPRSPGQDLDLGENRWLGLIKLACR